MPSFAEVATKDAEYRYKAKHSMSKASVSEEATFLGSLFTSTKYCSMCKQKLGVDQWSRLTKQYNDFAEKKTNDEVGIAIIQVVENLDAEHLRPSSICNRLETGVELACFGIRPLIENIAAK